MLPSRALSLSAFMAALTGIPFQSWALDQASGVNLTADEGFGARQQGMGLSHSGFQEGADAVINAPAAMNDVNDLTFSTTHLSQFGDAAHFDCASMLIPWHAGGTLGLAISRYAVSGIENRPDSLIAQPENPGLFTTSDWLIAGSFARRFGNLDLGGTVDLLYRKLDQSGLGLRADAMAQYTFSGQYRTGVFIRGLVPSTARWQSGYTEYEPPEAFVFASGRWDLPYFYGHLQAGFETPGLVQRGARSANELEGDRAVTDPVSLLKTSKLGAEFRFDFGLSLRAGLDELNPAAASSSMRLGAGYGWRHIVGIDYAFSAHPYLNQSHRLSLWWTPSFPRFEGRGFRPKPANRASAPYVEKQGPEDKSKVQPDDSKTQPGQDEGKEILEDE